MKFTVDGKILQKQLQAVSKVISSKNTIKILDNFLFTIDGELLKILGGDSENMLSASVPVTNVEGEGAVAINAKRLLDVTKEIDNQPLTFEVDDITCEITLRYMNGFFSFMGIDGEEYPAMRELGEDMQELVMPATMALKGIEHTWFAVSTETSRPVMTGIYWDIHPDDITFVSSDTHKLVKYVNREKAPGIETSFILPAKTANILKSLLTKEDEELRIKLDRKGGLFEFGDYFLYSVFINGNYPNYNRVIPSGEASKIVVDRDSLMRGLRRVNLFAPKSSNLVVLNLEEDHVRLASQDLDYSTSAEEMVMCEYNGNPMTIGFNGVFMVEILNNMEAEDLVLYVTDPARPCRYTTLQPKETEEFVAIQMPMQVL